MAIEFLHDILPLLLSLSLGFASAIISFTAWLLFVPLSLTLYHADLYTALASSEFIDIVNASCTAIICYIWPLKRIGEGAKREGTSVNQSSGASTAADWVRAPNSVQLLVLSVVVTSAAAAIPVSLVPSLLRKDQALIAGGGGFGALVVGLLFVLRGLKPRIVRAWRGGEPAVDVETLDGDALATDEAVAPVGDEERGSGGDMAPLLPTDSTAAMNQGKLSKTRLSLYVLGLAISGTATGIIGIGGGTNVAMLCVRLWGKEPQETLFLSSVTMAISLATVLTSQVSLGLVVSLPWHRILPWSGASIIGVLLGSFAIRQPSFRKSTAPVYLLIGTTLLALGAIETAQKYLID